MKFEMEAIGHVRATRQQAEDDYWGGTTATITLADSFEPAALDGLELFSHAEVLYVFDRVTAEKIVRDARHPRNNPAWPKIGIFAQRGKNRPHRIGSSIVRILGRAGRQLGVAELDAIDGTPVIDIKPVMQEFLPRENATPTGLLERADARILVAGTLNRGRGRRIIGRARVIMTAIA